ncbi:hypothetical protein ABWU59_29585 [Priestia megaterium]|uniref:hypothetical protein n=1 Tax=Priestia megaterium TaxID=1404 RepID=UPI0033957897
MYYSDEDFAVKVEDKVGNIRFFKKCLRERGLIGSRQQLSDEFIDMFREISQIRRKENSTWEKAINKVLNTDGHIEGMYKIQITETWSTESKETYFFTLITHIPFVPQIGMRWEDSDLDINLKVENLTYHSNIGLFVIKSTHRHCDIEEIEARIYARESTDWRLPTIE